MARQPLVIGPFAGGLNTYDDPTAVKDTELVECLNWDPGLEGSLRSRPPFYDLSKNLTLGATGNPRFLGFFYVTGGQYYLLASDGLSTTWAYSSATGSWNVVTTNFAATAMAQFNNQAWLTAPVGAANPGGQWTPGGGFVADTNMPYGDTIVSFKSRLWISPGKGNANGTRVYYSKVLGQPNFWTTPGFVDVGQGDGQDIVLLTTYYNTLVVFRTQSIYSFAFNSDPAQGNVSLLVPGIGLASKDCLISYESYLYFMYDDKAYMFVNNNANQINLKVPFTAVSKTNITIPNSVSLFNNRAIFHYYDTMYVFSLRTNTWTRWRSPQWGAIGQITSPQGILTDQAFVMPSALVGPETFRTNELTNPTGRGPTTGYAATGAGSSIGQDAGLDTYAITTTGGTAAGAFGVKVQDLVVGTDLLANTTYTFSADCSYSSNGVQQSVMLAAINTGVVANSITGFSAAGGFARRSITFTTAASGTVSVYVLNNVVTAAAVNNIAAFRDAQVELSSTFDANNPFFSGNTADTQALDYSWVGATNGSKSKLRFVRLSKLLYISEQIAGNVENMSCELRTKNYNYQLSSNFKRLFWWGVDAVFRTRLQGWAIPVVYSSSTTWGALRTAGKTWGQLLASGTWGSPDRASLEQKSDYTLSSSGPTRKFVKMFKSLRFRQIQFRLIFDSDGTVGSSPISLFTITAYVGTKETVSKTVS